MQMSNQLLTPEKLYRQCQLFSMSVDNVIKVWDLRTNKCTQTITHDEWPSSEDAQPLSMVYDSDRKRLITATRRPFMWQHKLIMKDRTGHRSSCVKAVYNSTFFVVVSVDDSAPSPVVHHTCIPVSGIGPHVPGYFDASTVWRSA